MPVIINDFEVVIEPNSGQEAAQAGATQQKTQTPVVLTPRPADIEQIMRRFVQRRTRLCAD